MKLLSEMATRERNLWAELLVDLVVALYYLPKMFTLISSDQAYLTNPAMAGLIVKTIILAIIAGILAGILLRPGKNPQKEDERDYQFSARGCLIANRVLIICVIVIMGHLAFAGLFPRLAAARGLDIPPMMVAHLLLISLILSSSIKSVAQLVYYRRGY
jgi:Na+/alanine symporter